MLPHGQGLGSSVSRTRPDWVDATARMPLAFAQVREDALLDESVVLDLGAKVDVLMVASGGCTAALLASLPQVRRLHVVDPNPSQLALTRVKLRLLAELDSTQRLALLGHRRLSVEERKSRLTNVLAELQLSREVLGPLPEVAASGPDYAGRYEGVFRALKRALRGYARKIDSVLRLADVQAQTRAFAPDTSLGQLLDEALKEVMSLSNLVRLFGEDATSNRLKPFHRHFGERIRWVMAQGQAASNPYLWQMLKGTYPGNHVAPWFTRPAPGRLPEIIESCAYMEQVLVSETAAYDFIHLSNILDWLAPDDAERILELAAHALRPAGRVLIRQLNSALDIRRAGRMFEWLDRESDFLLRRDRSFFYRAIHLGRRR